MPASEPNFAPGIRDIFSGNALAGLRAASDRLRNAGYGRSLPRSYEKMSHSLALATSPRAAIGFADLVSRVAIKVGVRAAEDLCRTAPDTATKLRGADGFESWGRIVRRIAETAPDMLEPFLKNQPELVEQLDVEALRHWVEVGLRIGQQDAGSRRAYFELEAPEARAILDEAKGIVTFRQIAPVVRPYLKALFGLSPPTRAAPAPKRYVPARRSSFASGILLFPDSYPDGVDLHDPSQLYLAAAAHMGAHLRFSPPPMTRRKLKPVQLALVALIEDARVEHLAMAELPGLRRLWLPYHDVAPGGIPTVTSLFRRLARALIDPNFIDPDEWVMRGRAMFHAPGTDLAGPAISRRIAGPLGRDLGQRRVQFNAKGYVVLPSYRDDGEGLWEPGETPPDGEALDVETNLARIGEAANPDEPKSSPKRGGNADPDNTARVRPIRSSPVEPGQILSRYPEYDFRAARSLPDWTTIKAYPTVNGDLLYLDRIRAENAALIATVSASLRAARLGQTRRYKRQVDGTLLDIDAAVGAVADLRRGEMPDTRIYENQGPPRRDLAVSILLDASRSTADRLPDSDVTILEVLRDATAVLSHGMDAAGDRFSVTAFNSDGREDVRIYSLKRFSDPVVPAFGAALSGMCPAFSTRLGAALRHVGAELAEVPRHRRLVLILTDGEPSDIDCTDPEYLIEDARRAVQELSGNGMNAFCVGLGIHHRQAQERIFGRNGFVQIDRIDALREVLPRIYARLTA